MYALNSDDFVAALNKGDSQTSINSAFRFSDGLGRDTPQKSIDFCDRIFENQRAHHNY